MSVRVLTQKVRLGQAIPTWLPVLIPLGVVALQLPALNAPLVETGGFRDTQTAFPALIYARDGIDLLHPMVPIFGPPWSLPFEFPIVQAAAALLVHAGLSVEAAMRGLGLGSFLAAALVLWTLLRRHVNERAGVIGVAIFALSPFALVWSRSPLIEYPVVLCSLLFMFGILEWHVGGDRRWLALAFVAGPLAAMMKITTAVFWIAPAILTRRWAALAACVLAAAAGLAWTAHADAVKAASSATAGLTSAALRDWNFGGDRFALGGRASFLLPILGSVLVGAAPLVAFRRERMIWAWFAVAAVGPLVAFSNLYVRHDYYWIAIAAAIAALVAGGVDRLFTVAPRVGLALVVAALVISVPTYDYIADKTAGSDPYGILVGAAIVRAASPGGELVALGCIDWNPAVFFYADRRGRVTGPAPPGYVAIDDPRVCINE